MSPKAVIGYNALQSEVEMAPFGSEVGSNARSAELNAPFGSGFGNGSDFPEPFRTRSNGVRTPNAAASPTCPISNISNIIYHI